MKIKILIFISILLLPVSILAVDTKKARLAELDVNNIYWDKSEWKAFCWETIESTEGEYDWDYTDEYVKDRQKKGVHIVAEIQPFANWDQDACHPKARKYKIKELGMVKKGMICDLDKYKEWLNVLVERYDNDGIEDMPGLKEKVEYWEIGNEPDMKCNKEDCYFDVTAKQYRRVLRASHEVIKEQDEDIKVLIAGPGTMTKQSRRFYRNIFKKNGKKYFDVFTYHAIYADARTDTLNVRKLNRFLKKNKIKNRPIFAGEWVALADPYMGTQNNLKRNLIQSTAYGLSHGIDKIFYIRGREEFPEETKKLLVKFFNYSKIYRIYNENIMGTRIKGAKYKFQRINGKKDFYLIWGRNQTIPKSLTGNVRVTDMHNQSSTMNVNDIILSADPIFIEAL